MAAKAKKTHVAVYMTDAEIAKLERLMLVFERHTRSDMIRFLVLNGEKILPDFASNGAIWQKSVVTA